MIDSTPFPDPEAALVTALQAGRTGAEATVSNMTPPTIPSKLVTIAATPGGYRDWGEAAVNLGINIFADTEQACRDLTALVQHELARISNDLIETVRVPVGGLSVPRQTPPFQRYFAVTALLRGQPEDDPS